MLANKREQPRVRYLASNICETTDDPIHVQMADSIDNAPLTRKEQHMLCGAPSRKLLLVDNILQQPRAKKYSSVVYGITKANVTSVMNAETKIPT